MSAISDLVYLAPEDLGAVAQLGPATMPPGYAPSLDEGVPTKKYVDDSVASAAGREQLRIVYLSKAGPAPGVTPDGLTLNTAFSDVDAAIMAAGTLAAQQVAPVTVVCTDSGSYALSASRTLPGDVYIHMPNAGVTSGTHTWTIANPTFVAVGGLEIAGLAFIDGCDGTQCSFDELITPMIVANATDGSAVSVQANAATCSVRATGTVALSFAAGRYTGNASADTGGVLNLWAVQRLAGTTTVLSGGQIYLGAINNSGSLPVDRPSTGSYVHRMVPLTASDSYNVVDSQSASWNASTNVVMQRVDMCVFMWCSGFTSANPTADFPQISIDMHNSTLDQPGSVSFVAVGWDNGTVTPVTVDLDLQGAVLSIHKGTNSNFSGAGPVIIPAFTISCDLSS